MSAGPEVSSKINVSLSQQETFNKLIQTIEKRTKFSIQNQVPPIKIVAYGGRGPSKFWKTLAAPTIVGTLAMHYSSPKRIATIFIKDIGSATKVTMQTEGWTDGDSRISTFVNILMGELNKYEVDEEQIKQNVQSEDPLNVLKVRFAKGEITKTEFEEMKKMLE